MPNTVSLRLTQTPGEPPTVLFDGKDITRFIAANGLQIDYDTPEPVLGPKITITLAPGKFELDFDVEVLERLLESARSRAAVA